MRPLLCLLLLCSSLPLFSQYAMGKRTIVFYDNNRSSRAVTTDLYYPANSAGTGVPLATGTEKFPVVVFGHGFVMPTSAYTWLADSLTRNGYIVAFPSTESSFSPSHDNFGKDIAFLCSRICSLNDSSANFLFGRVSVKSAAAGHSMGGGCSFLAMAANTNINAIFNFAAAETNPSAKTAALSIQKPALIFSGNSDCIVAPTEQLQMYNNIPYTCKSYVNILNALHCQFGNNDGTCSFGQITSGCNSSSITPAIVFEKVCTVLVPFLNYYLKGDCNAGTLFQTNFNALTGVTTQRTCNTDPAGCVVTGINGAPAIQNIRIGPNPVQNGRLYISSPTAFLSSAEILDLQGRSLVKVSGLRQKELTLHIPPARGNLIARISTADGAVQRLLLLK